MWDAELEVTVSRTECCFVGVLRSDSLLVVAWEKIHLGEILVTAEMIGCLFCE